MFSRLLVGIAFTFLIANFILSDQIPKYDRDLFGGWSDTDHDCQNMRHELLQVRSTVPITLSANGCRVIKGRWLDPYTDKIFLDSKELDIDHLVPLKYSWGRGAYGWTSEKQVRFANDPANLFAVQKSVNRQKSAFGPLDWLPPKIEYRCQYIHNFQTVVRAYTLEQTFLEQHLMKLEEERYCD